MKIDGKAVGVRLKILRLVNKKTAKQVSKDLGINLGTLYRYERDSSKLTIDTLEALLDYYGSNLYIFFTALDEYKQQEEE